jgi:hypothetical protein
MAAWVRVVAEALLQFRGYPYQSIASRWSARQRRGYGEAKIIVIDPDIDAVADRVCQTLNHDKAGLRSRNVQGLSVRQVAD